MFGITQVYESTYIVYDEASQI